MLPRMKHKHKKRDANTIAHAHYHVHVNITRCRFQSQNLDQSTTMHAKTSFRVITDGLKAVRIKIDITVEEFDENLINYCYT